MAKEYKITSLRLADLEKELNYLKTTREREIAAMIAEARSYGDLSENSEYDAAKNEQAKLYGRIAEIEEILSHAVTKPLLFLSAGRLSEIRHHEKSLYRLRGTARSAGSTTPMIVGRIMIASRIEAVAMELPLPFHGSPMARTKGTSTTMPKKP